MAALRSHALRSLGNLSTQSAKRPPFSSSVFDRFTVISHGVHAILSRDSNRMSARWRVSNSNAGSNYSPLGNGPPNWSDRPPTEMAPLFPGCDYEHWLVVMDAPGDGKAAKQEMVDCYVKTLAIVLGSEEAAIKSIYNVSTERYYGFGCQISEEISYKLKGCQALSGSVVDHVQSCAVQSTATGFVLVILFLFSSDLCDACISANLGSFVKQNKQMSLMSKVLCLVLYGLGDGGKDYPHN